MKRSLIKRKLGKVERALDKAIESAEIPGAVVLARMPREGEVLEFAWAQGFSTMRPERLPMTRETIFDLASLTKSLATTTGVMRLMEDGLVALDDPVAKYLPVFGERDKEAVTVRHLLTHSAGLKPWRGYHELMLERETRTGERTVGTPEGRAWILDRVLRSGLVHEPGEAAVYGDLDFIALGALVEEVSGQPLELFCAERIFEPLGMKETAFLPLAEPGHEALAVPEAIRRRIAATENCSWRKRILWGEVHDPNAFAMGGWRGTRVFLRRPMTSWLLLRPFSMPGMAGAKHCRRRLSGSSASARRCPKTRTGLLAGIPLPRDSPHQANIFRSVPWGTWVLLGHLSGSISNEKRLS
jgi:CubicO group peptidase (beta-lactamase class C family)